MLSLTPSYGIQAPVMITGNRCTGRYMVVLVTLVLLSFIAVLVWVHKHRTRERRPLENVACICGHRLVDDPSVQSFRGSRGKDLNPLGEFSPNGVL